MKLIIKSGKVLQASSGNILAVEEERPPLQEQIDAILAKEFVKEFSISDFDQVGSAQRYCLSIKKNEHGLTNPRISKIVLNRSDNEEYDNYATSIVCGERLLSTGTIKVYVTVDLSKEREYGGKIYLKGE